MAPERGPHFTGENVTAQRQEQGGIVQRGQNHSGEGRPRMACGRSSPGKFRPCSAMFGLVRPYSATKLVVAIR